MVITALFEIFFLHLVEEVAPAVRLFFFRYLTDAKVREELTDVRNEMCRL